MLKCRARYWGNLTTATLLKKLADTTIAIKIQAMWMKVMSLSEVKKKLRVMRGSCNKNNQKIRDTTNAMLKKE
jgi:hypothetical protein